LGLDGVAGLKLVCFYGNLFVLVNGSPTEEVNIHRGLKQGDPLAPFLFLLVVEGLSSASRSVEDRNLYSGFKIGNFGLSVSPLQYADETLFLGEPTVENLWSLKTIMRCFELSLGLKINLSKSNVFGVNVSSEFLGVAVRFLHCTVGLLPFKYLGLFVGANLRHERTWLPLIDTLSRRLDSWDNVFVSSGGRVTLLNSVLSAISMFFLSFMKIPTKVWRKVVSLQRTFLCVCVCVGGGGVRLVKKDFLG